MRKIQMLRCSYLLAAIVFGCCGCSSPLDYEKTSELEAGVEKTLPFDGSSTDQKVKIEVMCPDPVDVNVYTGKDKGKSLVQKLAIKNESFEVAIPANESFAVSLVSPKKTTAKIRANALGKNHNKDMPQAEESAK